MRRDLGGEGLHDSPCRPRMPLPARDPRRLAPQPPLGCGCPTPSPLPPRTGSVRPRPVSPAGSRHGLSRSGWRWKLVGINPGLDGPGFEVGNDEEPRSRREKLGRLVFSALGLRPSRNLSVRHPGPASVRAYGQGRGDERDQGQREGATLPGASGGGV